MGKAEIADKIRGELAELEKELWANRIYHFCEGDIWSPNPNQAELLEGWNDPSKTKFTFCGGNRKGKTTIGVIIAFAVMFGEWPWSGEKIPFPHKNPRRVMYVGQGWETHIKAVLEPELKKNWPKCRYVETKKNNQGVDAVWIDKATGSLLQVMSNNQESDSFEGGQWDLIIWDEPPKRANRIAATRGLIDRQGRELFAATLIKEAWLHREVIKARLENGEPDLSVFNVSGEIYDNVSRCTCGEYIQTEEIRDGKHYGTCGVCGEVTDYKRYGLTLNAVDNFARNLTKNEIEARIKGNPSYLGNLVLPDFDRDVHAVNRFKIPLNALVDISIDFHPSKPWAVLFEATLEKDFHYMYDFIYEKGNPKYIAEEIVRKIRKDELFVNSITIDPLSRGDKNAHIEAETVYMIMEKVFRSYNYKLETASKDKENGISILNGSLLTENGMPSRYVFKDMGVVIEHLEDWMYDPETFKPSKEKDDFCEVAYRIALRDTKWKDPYDRYSRMKNLPQADFGEVAFG